MICVAGTKEQLPPRLMEAVGRYRRKVFVDRLGWPLRSDGEIEMDEFDGPNAVYVSSQDEHGHLNGVARLLPTTIPYLLKEVFPSLWYGSDLPHSPETWELSRFAAVDFDTPASFANQASAKHAASLFRQVARVARTLGARRLVTVSPLGMERLLRINGFHSSRAGLPTKHGRNHVVALAIDVVDRQKDNYHSSLSRQSASAPKFESPQASLEQHAL
jgi:acyl homoserine lactone synthase